MYLSKKLLSKLGCSLQGNSPMLFRLGPCIGLRTATVALPGCFAYCISACVYVVLGVFIFVCVNSPGRHGVRIVCVGI